MCVVSSSVGMLPFLVGMDASQRALTGGAVYAWIGVAWRFFPFFFFFPHLLNFHINSLQQYQFSNIFLKKFNLYFFNYYLFCFKIQQYSRSWVLQIIRVDPTSYFFKLIFFLILYLSLMLLWELSFIHFCNRFLWNYPSLISRDTSLVS